MDKLSQMDTTLLVQYSVLSAFDTGNILEISHRI